jgi:hypothetical protein
MTAHRVARYQATGIGGKDNKAGGGRGATLWDRAPAGHGFAVRLVMS